MANGAPSTRRRPGALGRQDTPAGGAAADGFNADVRSNKRQETPVVVGGRTFKRVKKDWRVSRWMRRLMRIQEQALAKASRLARRISELEAEQAEAAAAGEDAREAELEQTIGNLVDDSDEATEAAELVTYRLIALLLKPSDADEESVPGFGLGGVEDENGEESDSWVTAVEFLQPALDVEDAAAMAQELTGSTEPDPQTTPSSRTGST